MKAEIDTVKPNHGKGLRWLVAIADSVLLLLSEGAALSVSQLGAT